MRAVLIPVKDLGRAKQRLAGLLSQAARTELAWAMLDDVFSAVAAARGLDRVFVVSSYAPALACARRQGWDVIVEHEQLSESLSVDQASRQCQDQGVRSLLRLPADIPLLLAADVEALLSAAESAPSALLVPSRSGTGTNALLRTPPTLFASRFGPGSLAFHLEEARLAGARPHVIPNARIALDIDDADDIRCFLTAETGETSTGAFLRNRWPDLHGHAPAEFNSFSGPLAEPQDRG